MLQMNFDTNSVEEMYDAIVSYNNDISIKIFKGEDFWPLIEEFESHKLNDNPVYQQAIAYYQYSAPVVTCEGKDYSPYFDILSESDYMNTFKPFRTIVKNHKNTIHEVLKVQLLGSLEEYKKHYGYRKDYIEYERCYNVLKEYEALYNKLYSYEINTYIPFEENIAEHFKYLIRMLELRQQYKFEVKINTIEDYKMPNYIDTLLQYIADNNLEEDNSFSNTEIWQNVNVISTKETVEDRLNSILTENKFDDHWFPMFMRGDFLHNSVRNHIRTIALYTFIYLGLPPKDLDTYMNRLFGISFGTGINLASGSLSLNVHYGKADENNIKDYNKYLVEGDAVYEQEVRRLIFAGINYKRITGLLSPAPYYKQPQPKKKIDKTNSKNLE